MIDFDVGFRAHTAGSFLLRGQKKRTKEKAARMTCPVNCAGSPVLLAHRGASKLATPKQGSASPALVYGARLRHTGLKVLWCTVCTLHGYDETFGF